MTLVQSDVNRVVHFRWLDIYRRRFDGVVIYFLKSDFKFFDDASWHPADASNARRYADRPIHRCIINLHRFNSRIIYNTSLKYGFYSCAASMKRAVLDYFASVSTAWLSGLTCVVFACLCLRVCVPVLCVCVVGCLCCSFFSYFVG